MHEKDEIDARKEKFHNTFMEEVKETKRRIVDEMTKESF